MIGGRLRRRSRAGAGVRIGIREWRHREMTKANLFVDDGVFAVDDDLSGGRDHEGRHQGTRLTSGQLGRERGGGGGRVV